MTPTVFWPVACMKPPSTLSFLANPSAVSPMSTSVLSVMLGVGLAPGIRLVCLCHHNPSPQTDCSWLRPSSWEEKGYWNQNWRRTWGVDDIIPQVPGAPQHKYYFRSHLLAVRPSQSLLVYLNSSSEGKFQWWRRVSRSAHFHAGQWWLRVSRSADFHAGNSFMVNDCSVKKDGRMLFQFFIFLADWMNQEQI